VIRGKAIKGPESRNIELTTVPGPWGMLGRRNKIFYVNVIEVFKVCIWFFLLIIIIMSIFYKLYING